MTLDLDGDKLSKVLGAIGYKEVSRLAYLYENSTQEVRHLLYFSIGGDKVLTADFGLLNGSAHQFSRDVILKYGSDTYRLLKNKFLKIPCFMRFSIGRFFGMQGTSRWDIGNENLYEEIFERLGRALPEFVGNIKTEHDLFSLLAGDVEPCPWFAVSGAIRAAQVAFLAPDKSKARSAVLDILNSKRKMIAGDLSGGIGVSFLLRPFWMKLDSTEFRIPGTLYLIDGTHDLSKGGACREWSDSHPVR